jgi:hypothetical protein
MVFHWKQCKEWGGWNSAKKFRNWGFPWGWNRRCVHLGQVCTVLNSDATVIVALPWSLYSDGIPVLYIGHIFIFFSKKSYNLHFLWFPSKQWNWRWVKLWIRNWELQIVLGAGLLGPSFSGILPWQTSLPLWLWLSLHTLHSWCFVHKCPAFWGLKLLGSIYVFRWTLCSFTYCLAVNSFCFTTSLMLRGTDSMPAVKFRKRSSWLCCRSMAMIFGKKCSTAWSRVAYTGF